MVWTVCACSCLGSERDRAVEKYSNDPSNHDGKDSWDTEVRDGNDWEWPWQIADANKNQNACCYQPSFRRGNCRRNKCCSRKAGDRGIGCRDRAYHLHDDIPCVGAEEEGTVHSDGSIEDQWSGHKDGCNEEDEAGGRIGVHKCLDSDRTEDIPHASCLLRSLETFCSWWQCLVQHCQTMTDEWMIGCWH